MFKPVKKTRIHEEIVFKIRDMIKEGRLKSGDQLPTERELAEAFKVSRPSVREALRALESQGYLVSRQGDGTYVTQQPIELLVEPFASVITKEKYDQLELFEMRRLLEPQIVCIAAERATPEEIEEMAKLVEQEEQELLSTDPKPTPEKTLHEVIFKAAKNNIISSIMDSLIDSLAESRDKYLQIKGRPEMSLGRHKEILAAIRMGDGQMAARIMREHLEETEALLFGNLAKYNEHEDMGKEEQ
ncbi:MAG: FadR family transcriptional regulator [bacterium]|nr:MAG: FadR family transcriptional regulator [bacterium]